MTVQTLLCQHAARIAECRFDAMIARTKVESFCQAFCDDEGINYFQQELRVHQLRVQALGVLMQMTTRYGRNQGYFKTFRREFYALNRQRRTAKATLQAMATA